MKKIAILLAFCISGTVFAAEPAQTSARIPDSDSKSSLDDDSVKMRLIYGPDRWLEIHSLIQVAFGSKKTWDESAKTTTDTTPKQTKKNAKWSTDASLNAARISLNGQLASNVYFFFQTDDLKAGASSSNGDKANDANGKDNMFTQDAYVKFDFYQPFQLYTGLLTVPVSRQNLQSQATMLTANGQSLVRSAMDGNTNKGRDVGAMIRGVVPGKNPIFEYRVGVFRGLGKKLAVDTDNGNNVYAVRNRRNRPRVAGRIQFSAGDTEDSYFLSENYLGKKNLFSWGAGADYQPDQRDKTKDYFSFGSDIDFDSRIIVGAPYVITMQVGFLKSSNLPDTVSLTDRKRYDIYAQTGLLAFGCLQPTFKVAIRKSEKANSTITNYCQKTRFVSPGLNYYFNDHFANIKFEFDIPVSSNKKRPDQYQATLQFQGYL